MTPDILIGFCKGTALLSRIIEWFERGGPSHAFALWRSDRPWGGWCTTGSEWNGWTTEAGEAMDQVVSLLWLPSYDLAVGMAKNRSALNAGYDIGGLLGMSWVEVGWHWLKRRVRNPLESKRRWFCSEIMAKVCRDSGVPLEIAPGETDPATLHDELVRLGAVEITDRAEYPVKWK